MQLQLFCALHVKQGGRLHRHRPTCPVVEVLVSHHPLHQRQRPQKHRAIRSHEYTKAASAPMRCRGAVAARGTAKQDEAMPTPHLDAGVVRVGGGLGRSQDKPAGNQGVRRHPIAGESGRISSRSGPASRIRPPPPSPPLPLSPPPSLPTYLPTYLSNPSAFQPTYPLP